MSEKILDLLLVGTGLVSLNFAEAYLKKNKKKKINIVSPINQLSFKKKNSSIEFLPSQMEGCEKEVNSFFEANNIYNDKSSKIIGSLKFGGLSNYWGLQMDNYISSNLNIGKKNYNKINLNFIEFLSQNKIIGNFFFKNKKYYNNDYELKNFYNHFKDNDNIFKIEKPILAFSFNGNKNKKNYLDYIKENKDKINSQNFFKKMDKKRIKLHDYYVTKIDKFHNIIKVFCRNSKEQKIFFCKKIIFASGTIATTKIIMEYLKIKNEVKIKHHPRLVTAYISRFNVESKLNFTPSLIQLVSRKKKLNFTADLRPGNNLISNSIVQLLPFLKIFKFLMNLFRRKLIFSNILISSKYSNLFIKKSFKNYILYSKKKSSLNTLKKYQVSVFKYLLKNKIIYPVYKNFFPGYGSDFHYFGSIVINKKRKLSVNENCQLSNNKNIYIIDGSIFDFQDNKYPLGIIISNARRLGKFIK